MFFFPLFFLQSGEDPKGLYSYILLIQEEEEEEEEEKRKKESVDGISSKMFNIVFFLNFS